MKVSDLCVYGLMTAVFFIALYIITLNARVQVKLSVPPTPSELLSGSKETWSILQNNIQYMLHHRPPLVETPPIAENMPFTSLYNIVDKWNPDHPEIPSDFKETLQHFDYGNIEERAMAEKFRNAELPFKLFNVTDFNDVANLWTDDYLSHQFSTKRSNHVEQSKNNHFMFWKQHKKGRSGFKPPTKVIGMKFDEWLVKAKDADKNGLDANSPHFYFMSSAPPRDHGRTFISRDLKLFSTTKNNFFITDVKQNKGIQCRFGMRGVIAESHYDSGRNMVAMLKGEKRYILTPPWSCKQIGIINDKKHPSYRHSVIDWSDMEQASTRGFAKVDAIDTVVRTGEVLYIPTYWFHYIISLRYSIQCNSRSGSPPNHEGENHVSLCMHF
mmetsp:Transcript_25690/g.42865  ORF Transcript_25690/g.42865 Transcript_25690/m.42865 type:complete len:384 (+) Transcript_25690:109-1260(+)